MMFAGVCYVHGCVLSLSYATRLLHRFCDSICTRRRSVVLIKGGVVRLLRVLSIQACLCSHSHGVKHGQIHGGLSHACLNILHPGQEGETHEWPRQALQGETVVCVLCGFEPGVEENEICTTVGADGSAVCCVGVWFGGLFRALSSDILQKGLIGFFRRSSAIHSYVN